MSRRYDRTIRWMLWVAGAVLVLMVIGLIRGPARQPWQAGGGPKVGLVKIEGVIMSSERVIRQLEEFSRRKDIEAILVRINSPGGTVAASQEIYQKLKAVSSAGSKPVIASLGTVAASGGYYVALAADTLMANPGTTTGSIGVILDYPVATDLLSKLGVQMEVVKSGALKDAGSPFRPPTAQDRRSFQRVIDDLHAQFVEVVAEERGMDLAEVKMLATGEIFSGRQAVDNGLVDLLGGFDDALSLIAALLDTEQRPVLVRPVERRRLSLWDLLLGEEAHQNRATWLLPQYILR